MRAFQTFSTAADDNGSADSTINAAEGQAPGTVNNGVRALMARLAAVFQGLAGEIVLGGTASAMTFTSPTGHAITTLAQPLVIWAKVSANNTGAFTLKVDTTAATSVKRQDGSAPEADDVVAGGVYGFAYDGTYFRLLNAEFAGEIADAFADHIAASDPHTQYALDSSIGSAIQAYSALLTSIAASNPSANDFFYAASATTISKLTSGAMGRTLLGAADLTAVVTGLGGASAVRTAIGNGTAATADTGTSGTKVPLLDGANTWSAAQTYSAGINSGRAVDTDNVKQTNTTTSHYLASRFASSGALFELTPAPSGTPDNTKGFGYDFTNSWWFCDNQIALPQGSVTAPPIRIGNEANGFFSGGSNQLNVALNGSQYASLTTSALTSSVWQFAPKSGTAGSPGFGFNAEATLGLYRLGSGNLGFTANALVFDCTTARVLLASGVDLQLNTATGPAASGSVGFRGLGLPSVKTADYTFVLADAGQVVRLNSASSKTFTLPTFASVAFPNGTVIPVENYGAGTLVLAAPSGGTLYNDAGASGSVTLNQHQGGALIRDADSGTNVWRYRGSHA